MVRNVNMFKNKRLIKLILLLYFMITYLRLYCLLLNILKNNFYICIHTLNDMS